jgi:hypothetical protein
MKNDVAVDKEKYANPNLFGKNLRRPVTQYGVKPQKMLDKPCSPISTLKLHTTLAQS